MSKEDGFDLDSMITDQEKEVEGVWRDFGKGAKVKVARWQNSEYQRYARKKFKANRVLLEQDDDTANDTMEAIIVELMAHTVLRDVSGFKAHPRINGGKVIEKYTPAIGVELLSIKDVREKVKAFSEDLESYLAKREEAAVN